MRDGGGTPVRGSAARFPPLWRGMEPLPHKKKSLAMNLRWRSFSFLVCLNLSVFVSSLVAPATHAQQVDSNTQVIVIDVSAPAHPFPHFWEKMFGSGRAILTLRESYRHDLREVKQITGFEYVRFHAIFHDEVGLYDEDAQGNPVFNFSYIDQIYDGLLANGVRPFVELSFMPYKLAADKNAIHAFWYKQNVSPPTYGAA